MKNVHLKPGHGLVMAALMAVAFLGACKKDNSASNQPIPENKQKVSLYLSDDPGYFDKVLLDIRSVEVLVDTCGKTDDESWSDRDRCWWDEDHSHDRNSGKDTCQLWDSLGIKPGVYDLLTLRNGADTLLAGGVVNKGTMERIRITIGDNNSLVKDGVTYPVKSISGQSKIIVRVRHSEWDELSSDNLQLWLDFDVQRSIIKTWNGKFILKPYINVFTILKMGSISGTVTPWDAYPVISIYNNTNDTLYALPWRNGDFKVRGLKVGDNWNVFVNASNGYQDTTITGVKVERGKDTKVGNIKLHK
ncbi:DUF4382 domain-containing protein [Chitinophaga arvensicola]|uniref:DUF4382 domain-containing protein n=1 Tax=Chitinophaga arvensicola TaxID=29529 RepID=A0A1I0RLC9_9BACT|nr:DUF4382 domain-containing protein [Chitinophaga arvensicola]SEW41716.1 protein of unknown function [Chitinophaga arvensicola]